MQKKLKTNPVKKNFYLSPVLILRDIVTLQMNDSKFKGFTPVLPGETFVISTIVDVPSFQITN